MLIVDTVCSLGGVPLFADQWGIDCIYSGSQKCLSGPPGAAPFFMSERAMEKLQNRKTKVRFIHVGRGQECSLTEQKASYFAAAAH